MIRSEQPPQAPEVRHSFQAADVPTISQSPAELIETAGREAWQDFVAGMIERIDLAREDLGCVFRVRIDTGKIWRPHGDGSISPSCVSPGLSGPGIVHGRPVEACFLA